MNTILKTILSHKRVTRNSLAELLKLSPSSIVKYVKYLTEIGIIRETTKKTSTAGRKSIYIEINNEIGVNIAVVFYASYIRGVLVDLGGRILDECVVDTYKTIPKDDELQKLYQVIADLADKAETANKKIFGIGLAIGGYMNPVKGISHEFLYASGWYDVPLRDLVESIFHIPCFLMNDANAYAMGDKFYGYGLGYNHFFTVKMDEGIGLGIVVNGELYLGGNNYSGEFGHSLIQGNTNNCYCGHTGCLETVCSKESILEECRTGLSKGVYSEITKLIEESNTELRIEHIITAANNGDRYAMNIFEKVGQSIGNKLSDVANVLNPQLIVFRGPIIDGNAFLFDTIQRVVSNQVLRHTASHLEMKYSAVNENMDVKGINSMILMDYFTNEVHS